MPLRCLLFSSNEEMVKPIWPVLAELGIEGEYCGSAVDAVEKVTTQLFQIVITDWDDQPEATFLLKTARDQKAAQRPLTLAIVKDEAKLPEALRAGANSVLLNPIRPEQVRDTMSTACELIRVKQASPAQPPPVSAQKSPVPDAPARSAVSSTAAAAAAAAAPAPLTQAPEKAFRAGEFLQSSSSAPGTQFDTESDVQKSLDQAAGAEVDALTELEPMAAAVAEAPAAELPETSEPLTGWASLQARLTKSVPQTLLEASSKNELLSYGETPSYVAQAAPQPQSVEPPAKQSSPETQSEAALFSYMAGESKEEIEPAKPARPKPNKLFLVGALAVACAVLAVVPRTRQSLQLAYRSSVRAGRNWLNPPPVQVPPTVTQHETFGQDGDEYKLPVAANIPDATTDPSQIRVLPVIDPTAKPPKGADAGGAQGTVQETIGGSSPPDQNQSASGGSGQPQTANPVQDQTATAGNAAAVVAATSPAGVSSAIPAQPNLPAPPVVLPQPRPTAQPQVAAPLHTVSAGSNSAIPSSLRTQTASMTPDASGAKPLEAAMSSIEPVNLPESAAWDLLAQKAEPVYPDAAKAGGQHGSVVLQVLIGRDGTVQDAKFMQGSLVFARSAIDAVKQWHFKPYSLNGRAVSVQSQITLKFEPPA